MERIPYSHGVIRSSAQSVFFVCIAHNSYVMIVFDIQIFESSKNFNALYNASAIIMCAFAYIPRI